MPLLSAEFTSGLRQSFDNSIDALIFGIGDVMGAGINKAIGLAGSAIEGASEMVDRGAQGLASAVMPNVPSAPSNHAAAQAMAISMDAPTLSPQSMAQVAAISQACPSVTIQDCSINQLGTGLEAPTFAMNYDLHQQQRTAGAGMMV